jgi:hypothetical protein
MKHLLARENSMILQTGSNKFSQKKTYTAFGIGFYAIWIED